MAIDQAGRADCRVGSYTRPILTEIDGTVAFEDLFEASMTETIDGQQA
jgi:hypothetical protein